MKKRIKNKLNLFEEAKEFLSALLIKRAKKPEASITLSLLDIVRRGKETKINSKIEGYGKRDHLVLLMGFLLDNPEMKPLVMEAMSVVMGKQLKNMETLMGDVGMPFPKAKPERSREKENFN